MLLQHKSVIYLFVILCYNLPNVVLFKLLNRTKENAILTLALTTGAERQRQTANVTHTLSLSVDCHENSNLQTS